MGKVDRKGISRDLLRDERGKFWSRGTSLYIHSNVHFHYVFLYVVKKVFLLLDALTH